MITYEDLTQFAPPAATKEERDAWFEEHGFDVTDLVRVGWEVGEFRLRELNEGDQIGERELLLLMQTVFLFGFELAVRCERDEKPDLTPDDLP